MWRGSPGRARMTHVRCGRIVGHVAESAGFTHVVVGMWVTWLSAQDSRMWREECEPTHLTNIIFLVSTRPPASRRMK